MQKSTEGKTLAVTSSDALAPTSALVADLSHFDQRFDLLLTQLPDFDDTELVRLAAHARRLEACAFRLRGACVCELRRRTRTRLAGGRGRRDLSGVGVTAHLARLAVETGASVATLKTDARIHEVFFSCAEETRLACEPSLAREFYVIALGAPDPPAAIRTALERRAGESYTRRDFRRDVLALKQPPYSTCAAPTEAKPDPCATLCVEILPVARAALTELCTRTGGTPEAVIAEALLTYHHSQTSTTPTHTPKKERRATATTERTMQPSLLPPSHVARAENSSSQAEV